MGATQNKAVSSRSGLSGSMLNGPQGSVSSNTGPSSGTGAGNATSVVSNQDEHVSVVFRWDGGGQNVFLAASFNGWSAQIPMVRSGNEFAVVQVLPRGVHQYKFIVDDQWRFAPDQPKTQDGHGNMNNVCDVSRYQHFAVDTPDEPCPRFSQQIPDPNSYIQDAPAVPIVLGKSSACAVEQWLGAGAQTPNIPTHSICDHVYLWQGAADASDPTQIVVTHRYGKKYSTTVFATRSRGMDVSTAPSSEAPVAQKIPNLLKAAVVRK